MLSDGQREALAKALAGLADGEDWPTNAELGGGLTGTRDDEYRAGKLADVADIAPLIEQWISEAVTDALESGDLPDGWEQIGIHDLLLRVKLVRSRPRIKSSCGRWRDDRHHPDAPRNT